MLESVKNEPIVKLSDGSRWEYVRDTETGYRGYLHQNCDAIVEDGHCVMCGAPEPRIRTMVGEQ